MAQVLPSRTAYNMSRHEQALALRREYKSYGRIGAIMGVAKSTAYELVMSALAEQRVTIAEHIDTVRSLELARLDQLEARLYERFRDRKNLHPERTVDSMIRLMERRAALMGLDAPKDFRLSQGQTTPAMPEDTALDTSLMTVEDMEVLESLYAKYGRPVKVVEPPATQVPAIPQLTAGEFRPVPSSDQIEP